MQLLKPEPALYASPLEELIAQGRIADACAAVAFGRTENDVHAAVYALAGDDRGLVRFVRPELLACRTGGDVAAYYAAANLEPNAYDHLVAGTVLAWSPDEGGACACFEAAHRQAISERRFDLAAAARERLAHHAMLFGNVKLAHTAIQDAIALAQRHGYAGWLLRSLATDARFALDIGDLDRTAQVLARGRAAAGSPEALALFAASGAQLAVELGDDTALRAWTSPEILEAALHSALPEAAIAATIAGLIAAGAPVPAAPGGTTLRRALLLAGGAANAAELFSVAARYGELDEARFAVEALAAVFAPNRPYLNAHHLLARAHFLFRSGKRGGWIDCAGDAARAFTAMGLRRWTNEAMRLLVAQESSGERRTRGRSIGSALTEREEQVAHLIRRGARNREVAAALQISEHTVERHVSSILGRLGLRSRWQIVDAPKSDES
jgi:DNA-binding CsgD family transcriptional regulator